MNHNDIQEFVILGRGQKSNWHDVNKKMGPGRVQEGTDRTTKIKRDPGSNLIPQDEAYGIYSANLKCSKMVTSRSTSLLKKIT